MRPKTVADGLFLAFRRRCAACSLPTSVVMIGPADAEIHGATAVSRHPHTVLELPLDELSGASLRLHFSETAIEKWRPVAGTLSLPPGEIDVALEVASPVAVARIAVRKPPRR